MNNNETRNCETHGYTQYRLRTNKKGSWYSCEKCLRDQWKKAQNKRREKKEGKEYQRDYRNNAFSIYKHFTLYIRMLLLLSQNLPE